MTFARRLLQSSLGRTYLMALTGAGLFGFLTLHMLGNLMFFFGPEAINSYASFLQHVPELLWPARAALAAMVGAHLWAAITLTLENRAARPVAYEQVEWVGAGYAARTMIWSGLVIGSFVVYHLLHYTVMVCAVNLTGQDFHALHDAQGRHDVYRMVVLGFSHPAVALFYAAAISVLCFHLGHGLGALFQSVGLKSQAWTRAIDLGGQWAAWLLWAGYLSIPLAVTLGLGKEALK
jgi:succinate dehydrogenase / fumarate reductase cytochrome b subunit